MSEEKFIKRKKTLINKKITTIGEALVDWVCLDKTLDLYEAANFIKAPGGAPANVAVGLAKLKYPVQFVGGFSTDLFGKWLKEFLSSYDIDLTNSVDIPESNTRNAYIFTDKNGNRVLKGFSNYANADSMLDFNKINIDAIANSPLVYFGSVLQATEKSRYMISNLINAVVTDNIVVYDPNLRLCLWPDTETAVNIVKDTFKTVDVVKLSDDEITLITNNQNIEEAAKQLFETYHLKLLVVTMGKKGSLYINKQGSGFVKSFNVETVEVTGAGDAFVAGLLSGLYELIIQEEANYESLDAIIEQVSVQKLEKIMLKANALGAITTTKAGATAALPTTEELKEFLQARNGV
jgi:sugar/nucleoside kinase (ribokinase family)